MYKVILKLDKFFLKYQNMKEGSNWAPPAPLSLPPRKNWRLSSSTLKQIKETGGQVENSESSESSEFCFWLFLFRPFDFDLIPKIENSEEENSEKKFRGFRVFDLPLFRIFNQVSQIWVSVQLDWVCFACSFVFLSYFVWIWYCRVLGSDYLTCKYILKVTNIIKEQCVLYL